MFDGLTTGRKAKIVLGVIIVFVIIFARQFYFIIDPGEMGLVIRLGTLQAGSYGQGLYLKAPFIDTVKVVDVTIKKVQNEVAAASKDLQSVQSTVALSFRLDASKVVAAYKTFGTTNIDEVQWRVIDPAIQESVKASTAKFTAEQLITKRQEVSVEMEQTLKSKLSQLGITVDAINIVNFQFSEDFNKAIESKVRAEQDALAEKNRLEKTKYEAQQKIEAAKGESEAALLRAKAEAEAIRIKTEAIKAQGGKEYVQLNWIEQRDGKLPQTTLGDSPVMIDLRDKE